jgi:hypothetical protein
MVRVCTGRGVFGLLFSKPGGLGSGFPEKNLAPNAFMTIFVRSNEKAF